MRKLSSDMCVLQRLKSACASPHSDQSSLSAWRNLSSFAIINVSSEDSDPTARMGMVENLLTRII